MTQASESWGFSWDVNREPTALGAAFWDLRVKMEQQSKDTERNLFSVIRLSCWIKPHLKANLPLDFSPHEPITSLCCLSHAGLGFLSLTTRIRIGMGGAKAGGVWSSCHSPGI